jgi:hypothetical protein
MYAIKKYPLVWPIFYSCISLFRCLFNGQWNFCLGIIPVHALCLFQCNPSPLHFLVLLPYPVLTVFSLFPCILFLHRCDIFHYHLLFFFPSFPSYLVSSTSPNFGYIFCMYLHVYITLFVFDLDLYSRYERKHAAFGL